MNARLVLTLCIVLAGPSGLWAQAEAPSDSTAAPPSGGLAAAGQSAIAQADSAGVDSLAVEPDFVWFSRPSFVFSADVRADVSAIGRTGTAQATHEFMGHENTTKWTSVRNSFRQQDRDNQRDELDINLKNGTNPISTTTVQFQRKSSEDVTTIATGDEISIENTHHLGRVMVDGNRPLPGGVKWVAGGEIENFEEINRGVRKDRTLADGGVTTRWNHLIRRGVTLSARAGLNRATGERALGDLQDDATTSQDTVGATVLLEGGARGRVSIDLDRVWFREQRLDFFRSATGAIDTANVDEKIGLENERKETDRFSVNASRRLLPVLGISGNYNHDFSETSFSFSQQGIIQRGGDRVDFDLDFRYAEAGSLTAELKFGDSWNDRRVRGVETFRGREIRRTKEATLEFKQRVMHETDLDLGVGQRLTQNIYEDEANKNDRDQLVERLDAELRSRAIPRVTLNLGGSISRTDEIRIASERVGNNKEDRLFEVRGSASIQATQRITIDQSTRLQIVFNDFHNSNDRDKFNKQGQFSAGATIDMGNATRVTVDYTADFRSSGTRADDGRRDVVSYQTTLRSLDHQIRATIGLPVPFVPFLSARVDTKRGFLRRENPALGTEEPEDRGEFRAALSGGKKFLDDQLEFRVDVTRVLAFGPRVREQNEDYWIANSGVSLRF